MQATRILSFNPAKVTTNPSVIAFYQAIEREQAAELNADLSGRGSPREDGSVVLTPSSGGNMSQASAASVGAEAPAALAGRGSGDFGGYGGGGDGAPAFHLPLSMATSSQPLGLSDSQRARIEASKQAALAKRRESTASTASTASYHSNAAAPTGWPSNGWSR